MRNTDGFFAEATMSPSAVSESNGLKAWSIVLAVLLPVLIVGLVAARVVWWKKSRGVGAAYTNCYKKQSDDIIPLETDANVDSSTL